MKQKIILSLFTGVVALVIPGLSYADLGTIQPGFFVGLAADAVIPNYGYKPINSTDIKKSSNSLLFRPDLYLGYGELVSSNNLYIGFDAGFQVGNKTSEVAYYNNTTSVRNASQGTVYYADVLPGFVFGNQSSIFYGIVGATHGSFKLQQTGSDSANFSQSEGHFGYRIGAGYNLALTDSFSVGFKYLFSNFGSVGYTNGDFNYQLNPKNNEFSLGINYTFGGSNASTQSPFVGD